MEPEPDKYCNVTFDTSGPGGDGTIKTVKMQYGELLPIPTPAKGYNFEGWYDGNTKITTVPNSPNRTITGKFAAPIIIEINDREQKTNGFNRIFSRQIICSGHNISLELNTIVTYWSSYNKDYTFKTGDQSKEVLRWDYNNSWGPNDEPIEEDIRIEFVSFSLMIDGVKIISKETYTSKSTNDLYYVRCK